ncbi:MAG TPA: Rieske 2Fe-2S domain-containing protein [Chloroflexota bacterium]|nr:Rieske 2Fe-2S domain-containing protein [Chloroflexota bacterium]
MLSTEDNEAITRVGPGTLMGNLMRQYWVPAMLSSEVEAGGEPVRIMLLGEKLIAFRDSDGQVGLVDNHCPHRGASLFFGRNEECGLRCVYHGWKFDVRGNCVDMPNEPPESNFKHKVRVKAYPCRERGGVVWTYMGSRQEPPPLPELEANMLPEGQGFVNAIQRECNWLQALEGDIDTSHFSFLHMGSLDPESQPQGSFAYYVLKDRAPRYSVVETDGGTMYGAYRDAGEGQRYWRVAQFLFPFFTMPPQGVLGHKIVVRAWVPMDDEHTMFIHMSPRIQPISLGNIEASNVNLLGRLLPRSSDWYGRFRMAANAGNDYEIDRDKQRRNEEYTGIKGIHLQDQAITESMGAIYDRSQEHLASSDAMIIQTRRRLLNAARELEEKGAVPPGVDDPAAYHVRAGGTFLPRDAEWLEATRELRRAFVTHPEIDTAVSGGTIV